MNDAPASRALVPPAFGDETRDESLVAGFVMDEIEGRLDRKKDRSPPSLIVSTLQPLECSCLVSQARVRVREPHGRHEFARARRQRVLEGLS